MHIMVECKREKPRQQCSHLITLQYRVFHLRDKSQKSQTLISNCSGGTHASRGGKHFNTPDIVWSEGFSHVRSNPSYGTAVNYSLLDLASDYHLEQSIHENTHLLDLVFSTNL